VCIKMNNDPLFLHVGFLRCSLHPVVVVSILDHFTRRNEGQSRIIGTLLGANNDGVVEIRNSFALPVTDGGDKMKEYHRIMHDLHYKTNPQEMVVGWYITGTYIDEESIRIHDFFGVKCFHHLFIFLLIQVFIMIN